LIAAVLAVFVLSVGAHATTWTVGPSGEYATIQAAINVASDGDIITVANGSYTGDNLTSDVQVTIESVNGPTNTTITASGSDPIFSLTGGASDLLIDGFSITGTDGASAIDASAATATFENCIFYGNAGVTGGGAMLADDSAFTFENCVFANNTASGNGGALNIDATSSAALYNCSFTGNSAVQGGAIWVAAGGGLDILNSILWNDTITGSVDEGGPEIDWPGVFSGFEYYNDIQDKGYAGINDDISQNPLYDAPSSTPPNLSIPANSPAAAAGAAEALETPTDITGTPWANYPSMGAYQAPSGPVAQFQVSAPSNATAGVPFQFTVTALDVHGNVVNGYTGRVSFSTTDPGAGVSLPSPSVIQNTTKTFWATLVTAGSWTITAKQVSFSFAGPVVTGTSAPIIVGPSTATHFSVTVPTYQVSAGVGFTATVTALDNYGNVATSYSGTPALSTTDTGADVVLPATATVTNGTGTFSVTLVTAGQQTLSATDSTVSPTLYGTSLPITVAPGPPSSFVLSAPSTATAGTSFSVTITAVDQYGNTATGYNGSPGLTTTDTGAAVVLPATVKLTKGTATFSATLVTAGNQTITATDSTVSPSLTGTSNKILVGAGPLSKFVLSATSPEAAGTSFAVGITAVDAYGNTVTSYNGSPTLATSDANPAVVLPASTTLSSGTGSFSATLITAGSQTITATDATYSPSITGTVSVTVIGGPATKFVLSAPATSPAGSAFTVDVTATDQYGNTASYNGSPTLTTSDTGAGVSLPATVTLTAGTGSFSATLVTAGSQTITATDSTVTPNLTGSTSITIDPLEASSFKLSAPATTPAGVSFSVNITALDSYGNTATSYNGSPALSTSDTGVGVSLPASVTLSSGTGSFGATLVTLGSQSVTAKDGPITGSTSITVVAGPAAKFVVSAASPQITGVPFTFTVTAVDQFGNTASGYSGTATFTSSDSAAGVSLPSPATLTNGSGTFNATLITVGYQTITATDSVNSLTGTSKPIEVDYVTPTVTSLTEGNEAVNHLPADYPQLVATVHGTNFVPGITILFGITPLTPLAGTVTPTSLEVTIPANLRGSTVQLGAEVTQPDSTVSKSSTIPVYVMWPQPKINNVTPGLSAPVGSSAITLTITGGDWPAGTKVSFGSYVFPTSTIDPTGTILTVVIPTYALANVGTFPISVTIPQADGTYSTSNQVNFYVYASSVTITSISPTSTTVGVGPNVTIHGTGFVPGVTVVNFGAAQITPVLATSTQLTIIVPNADVAVAGQVSISVTVSVPAVSPVTSNTVTFNVLYPAPTITSPLQPSSAPINSAFTLTLTGTGFVSGATTVYIGADTLSGASVTVNTATSLTALVPANTLSKTGTVIVSVGVLQPATSVITPSNKLVFSLFAPAVTSVSPNKIPVVVGATGSVAETIYVNGSGFVPTSSVSWDGNSSSASPSLIACHFVSSTQIEITGIDGSLLGSTLSSNVVVTDPGGAASATGSGSLLSVVVAPTTTTMHLSVSGPLLTFSATVATTSGQAATGQVRLVRDLIYDYPEMAIGAVATYSVPAGKHTFVATYTGDSVNASSSSASQFLVITAATSTTTVTSSVNPSNPGQKVAFTAKVTGDNPTGTVAFAIDGGTPGVPVTVVNGSAQFSTATLAAGKHTIVAQYSGDAYNTSSSGSVSQTVK
jgi:hypothetical protein